MKKLIILLGLLGLAACGGGGGGTTTPPAKTPTTPAPTTPTVVNKSFTLSVSSLEIETSADNQLVSVDIDGLQAPTQTLKVTQ